MALNNGEAHAVNTLLRWVLGLPNSSVPVPAAADAHEAAQRLCRAAYKQLSAGLWPDQVTEHWPAETPVPAAEVVDAAQRLRADLHETIGAVYGEIGGHSDVPDAAEADQRRIVTDHRLVLDWVIAAAGGAR
ncbi:hypothetical protein NQK81_13405 [Amycolatopsis roodepoortensis]|uniref:hypothetical protein n=1 Tax=Amycolatopsis roodepoortensis TaxID=700274 RepID=UPI00214AA193|nr:hypothetical protein [Amycolatopsis roodepoortensis]UUV34402.1 hypothetical protein NQK81_13405 [Amycolatopsis roodepoortensis]